jgi:hypothetical protein
MVVQVVHRAEGGNIGWIKRLCVDCYVVFGLMWR